MEVIDTQQEYNDVSDIKSATGECKGVITNVKLNSIEMYVYEDKVGTEIEMKSLECSNEGGLYSKGICDVAVEEIGEVGL